MRESFPDKSLGDRLSYQHINRLNSVARRIAGGNPGSYAVGHSSSGVEAHANIAPWVQDTYIVTQVIDDGLYLVQPRYYDHTDELWKTNKDSGPWLMDGTDLGVLDLSQDDKVVAFYDSQRQALIPIAVSSQPMWCAQVCECALVRADSSCCVYRGKVKRYGDPGEGGWTNEALCDPPREVRPAFILTDCSLLADEEGWVKKIAEDVEISWTPASLGTQITEKLDLYEWCCWPSPACPTTAEKIFARFSYVPPAGDTTHVCPVADGIEVELEWREDKGQPTNNPECIGDRWTAEFSVMAEVPIRVMEIDYALELGGPENETGFVKPNWLTGEPEVFYNESLTPMSEPPSYAVNGFCRILTDSGGNVLEELITRWYRLSVECNDPGNISSPCIQHLYPPGHPIYLEQDFLGNPGLNDPVLSDPNAPIEAMEFAIALPEAELHQDLQEVCSQNFVSKFDAEFGQAHNVNTQLGVNVPDGLWDSTWPIMHTFGGCFDEPEGTTCQLLISQIQPSKKIWQRITVHWSWASRAND